MKLYPIPFILIFFPVFSVQAQLASADSESYLSWSASQAEGIGKEMRVSGRVGRALDLRVLHTERAINYKLRATLMTADVIRAVARLEQIRSRLTDQQTRNLVEEAETVADLVVMVELDPREGSGVIPLDWRVFLEPKGLKPGSPGAVSGIKLSQLRNVKALAGAARRDYDYDVFWVSFPLVDENKNVRIPADTAEIQLLVGIYGSEGRVSWRMPASLRERLKVLSKK